MRTKKIMTGLIAGALVALAAATYGELDTNNPVAEKTSELATQNVETAVSTAIPADSKIESQPGSKNSGKPSKSAGKKESKGGDSAGELFVGGFLGSLALAIPIVAIICSIGFPVVIIVVILRYVHKRNKLRHDTLALMIEKGMPINPEIFNEPKKEPSSPLVKGFSIIGLGLALILFFWQEELWAWGLIPLFAGVGILVEIGLKKKKADAPK